MSEIRTTPFRAPRPEEIGAIVRESGYYTSTDTTRIINALDDLAPVLGQFTVDCEPDYSPAPEEIRREWVGLSLPVRAIDPSDDGYPVLIAEAMNTLWSARKVNAYWWWHQHLTDEWERAQVRFKEIPNPGEFPHHIANTNFLIFDEKCGKVEWGTPAQKTE